VVITYIINNQVSSAVGQQYWELETTYGYYLYNKQSSEQCRVGPTILGIRNHDTWVAVLVINSQVSSAVGPAILGIRNDT
jgi:hypothetical protein